MSACECAKFEATAINLSFLSVFPSLSVCSASITPMSLERNQTSDESRLVHQNQNVERVAVAAFGLRNKAKIEGKRMSDGQNAFHARKDRVFRRKRICCGCLSAFRQRRSVRRIPHRTAVNLSKGFNEFLDIYFFVFLMRVCAFAGNMLFKLISAKALKTAEDSD